MSSHTFALSVPGTDLSVGIDFDRVPQEVKLHLIEYAAKVKAERLFARGRDEAKPSDKQKLAACEELRQAWYDGRFSIGATRNVTDPRVAEGWACFFAHFAKATGPLTRAGQADLIKLGFIGAIRTVLIRANQGRNVSEKKLREAIAAHGEKIAKTADANIAARAQSAADSFEIV